ncbi:MULTISPECIES: Gfo/Idh/MocA family protein [Halomonadaceae]|jgi:D-galactose 1-dehydrogenase|uniref:Gfo/Idh/MocA family oxidoreductase n=1 Tax=Vreelandella janggokensis TaxID=370767 RepID=A0ABT4ITU0_9GAMM|nr:MULTISPECIES: Gfo/Idh/MocA family oxidoreductase [Halomonas]MCW4150551.1 Gfo/Idh/MocA family oxidoreductase [Halomonas sp. 18H]MCZ0927075.1 Gfo/Idh/MocA family oxidoreductase [Halomonas janggokensis]MCZ0929583.1 Gfo/Idh/MocA family oxidoreductase [Halomonas janggokensis]MDR5886219.1 Gfo/Idh/MocA family oxidoreductase [Halomonas janggokensis]QPL45674.1 Gfo/Idh/MocA family oxidoreductase [Halomonas sp. A40-4]
MSDFTLGLVGVGKIVRDQHLPAIAATPNCHLVATADPYTSLPDLPGYQGLEAMLDAHPDIDAVAICTPTHLRYSQARAALLRGKHVLLEKPPGATLSEVEDLIATASRQGVSLFAAWHSRFAPGVAQARKWLSERQVQRVEIEWKEDVRVWHPGQAWIWEVGGMGVFDPGINALSIATAILPQPFFLQKARLQVPSNAQTPIAAELSFTDPEGALIEADFDFRQPGPPTWDMHIDSDGSRLSLTQGGCRLVIDDDVLIDAEEREYQGLYARFGELITKKRSEVDVAPLRQVADAFLYGHRETTDAFIE